MKNDDITLSISLTAKQKQVIEWCELGNGIQYVIICTGRQVGKTVTAQIVASNWAIETAGYEVGFFLPTHKQCKNVFRRMMKMFGDMKHLVTFNKSEFTVTFWNGSSIQFFTSENDNCRGFTFGAIIVDEACFIKDDIWQEAIQATVAVSLSKKNAKGEVGYNGKVLLLSTPKTKNWFYGMVKDEDERTRVTRFTSEEGGIIASEILQKIKKQIPDSTWLNEYMGEFLDAGSGLFKYLPCIRDVVDTNGCVAGLDLGAKEDYTVLTIMNRAGELIYINRWNKQEWNTIMDTVAIELVKYGSPIVHVETNGVGQMPYEYLRKKYGKVKEWVTTNKSKNDIIQKLIVDFNTKDITILDVPYLKDELDFFTIEYKNGKATYEGSNGCHDDSVLSLAICNYHRSKVQSVKPQSFNPNIRR